VSARRAGAVTGWIASLALLASTAVLAPAVAGEAPAARDVPIRVASYNIHAGAGEDGSYDLARTASAIRALDADVVGLQEVDVHWGARSQWADTAQELADRLGMRVFFAPIYSLDPPAEGQPRREYGVAVLSSWPIVSATNHPLTRLSTVVPDPTPEPAPGFPEVVIEKQGARVHVYTTHLDYRADPSVRQTQVAETLDILADEAGESRVLVGDFNATPDAPELAPLWSVLTDSWAAAPTAGTGLTYPAITPTKRIDYVTTSTEVEVVTAHVLETAASDHRPVVADLAVRRGDAGGGPRP
jgi:endonuclease/exonuclease/phosphatase family metal-dependent hydrolase